MKAFWNLISWRRALAFRLPLGNVGGVKITLHWSLIAGLIFLWCKGMGSQPVSAEFLGLLAVLFLSVLLHEFGHVFMARRLGLQVSEVMLWVDGGMTIIEREKTDGRNSLSRRAGRWLMFCS